MSYKDLLRLMKDKGAVHIMVALVGAVVTLCTVMMARPLDAGAKMRILYFALMLMFASSCGTYGIGYQHTRDPQSEPQEENFWEARIKNKMTEFDRELFSEEEFPVTEEVSNPKTLSEFRKKICSGRVNTWCEEKHLEMFNTRLSFKYYAASRIDIDSNCRAYPVECKSMKVVEYVYIRSHNAGIEKKRENWKIYEQQEINRIRGY